MVFSVCGRIVECVCVCVCVVIDLNAYGRVVIDFQHVWACREHF